jgi:PAS domain-containing protein
MSFKPQGNYLDQMQPVFQAELQSEKWVCRVRLTLAGLYLVTAILGFIFTRVSGAHAFMLQCSAIALLTGYSLLFLRLGDRRLLYRITPSILLILDVAVITAILWSYLLRGVVSPYFHVSLFCVYFIPILFTALHNRMRLAVLCGAVSIAGYSSLWGYYFLHGQTALVGTPESFLVRIAVLMVGAVLAGFITRNNFSAIQKITMSEMRYENLVHRLPEVLLMLDKNGKILWANMTVYALLGVPSQAVCGRRLGDFMCDPDALKLSRGKTRDT